MKLSIAQRAKPNRFNELMTVGELEDALESYKKQFKLLCDQNASLEGIEMIHIQDQISDLTHIIKESI